MAKANIKTATDADLKKELKEKQKALLAFRFGSAGSKTRNVKEGQQTRKEVARILTELNSRRDK